MGIKQLKNIHIPQMLNVKLVAIMKQRKKVRRNLLSRTWKDHKAQACLLMIFGELIHMMMCSITSLLGATVSLRFEIK